MGLFDTFWSAKNRPTKPLEAEFGQEKAFLFANILLNKKNSFTFAPRKDYVIDIIRANMWNKHKKRYRYGNEKNLPAFSS